VPFPNGGAAHAVHEVMTRVPLSGPAAESPPPTRAGADQLGVAGRSGACRTLVPSIEFVHAVSGELVGGVCRFWLLCAWPFTMKRHVLGFKGLQTDLVVILQAELQGCLHQEQPRQLVSVSDQHQSRFQERRNQQLVQSIVVHISAEDANTRRRRKTVL
jgi:hypothetical protein